MQQLKMDLVRNFVSDENSLIGKSFKEYVLNNRESFWNFSVLEQKILSLNEFKEKYEKFFVSKKWERVASVEIDSIVGTDHGNYIGISYLEMLERGIKMDINIPLLLKNPSYYYSLEAKEPTAYYAVFNTENGKRIAFVDNDGNHRTCLAKVLRAYDKNLTKFSGITKTSYQIDYKLMRGFLAKKKELERIGFFVDIKRIDSGVEEDPTGKWIKWKYKHKIIVKDKNGKDYLFDDMEKLEPESFLPVYKRFFSKIKSF